METLRITSFIGLVRTELESRLPSAINGRSDEDVRALIVDGIRRAETLGLTDGWDIYRYIEYRFRFGADFEARPEYSEIAGVLRNTEFDGEAKMNWVDWYHENVIQGPSQGSKR